MSKSAANSVRYKRFKVKDDKKIDLQLETVNGLKVKLNVADVSTTGIHASCEYINETEAIINQGPDIIPNAKLIVGTTEYGLGRLVVRRLIHNEDKLHVAFSAIDTKVPVEGEVSRFLDIDTSGDALIHELELSPEKFSLVNFIESEYSNIDLLARLKTFQIFHKQWVKSDKYGYQNERIASKGSRIKLARTRGNGRNDYIIMGSNDYLGLSAHPEVIEAAKEALDVYGLGSTGSPVTTGLSELHSKLVKKIADIHNKESALLFNSGYTANIGIITALLGPKDLVIADQLSHASIQDGMLMSKGVPRFFKHNNLEHLEKILKEERASFNGCLIITEGVFSMDGDVPPLDKIIDIARKYNARIMIDQAHCFGVLGKNGFGACDKFKCFDKVDIIMGTFSKICGGIGGFVTGSKELIDWLRSFSRAHIFSVSIAPSMAAGVLKSLELLETQSDLLKSLRANITHFTLGLRQLGFNISDKHESTIFPVVIGDEHKLGLIYQSLLEMGVFVVPVVYPVVSRKLCRLRFTVMASHTISDLDYVLQALETSMTKANFQPVK